MSDRKIKRTYGSSTMEYLIRNEDRSASHRACTGAPASIQPGAVVALAKAVKRLHYLANHHCSDSGEWFTDRPDNFEAMEAVEAALALYNGTEV